MRVQVYRYCGLQSRSVMRAELVAEFDIDEFPTNQITFAREHGGDFIEITDEEQE